MQPIVTDRVAWSVNLSVCHTSEPYKTAAPIEMPFGLMTRVGPGNHVLDGGPDPPWEGGKRVSLRSSVQKRLNRSRCRLGCGLGLAHGITNYMGVQIPNGKGQFWEKGSSIVNIGTFYHELCKSL